MFCERCGASNPDDGNVCMSCGHPIPDYAKMMQRGTDYGKYIKPAVAVVAVIIVIGLLSSLFGGGYKKPIKKMVKYAKTAETDYFFDAFPKNLVDELDKDAMDELEEELEEAEDVLKDIDDLKISYKIEDKEKMDEDDREDLEEMIEKVMEEMDSKTRCKVTKAYILEIDWEIDGDYDGDEDISFRELEDELGDQNIIVAKVNGDWGIVGTEEILDEYNEYN